MGIILAKNLWPDSIQTLPAYIHIKRYPEFKCRMNVILNLNAEWTTVFTVFMNKIFLGKGELLERFESVFV